ncbi:YihY/virulence factor BrkB family protein [Breoghania sp.]|uniref:YihY/virulence factor BrkB family protein n=1 Tax=Breoghania sp. TaxID=2065378 RepID=UPI002607441A|nr:YihY/virulence factor BrkB family protein [Breoghania sp.]MDJ0932918.1 YihY/virulence factor BrkB family protein [Breoghania sp.]
MTQTGLDPKTVDRTDAARARERGRGRSAAWPSQIPLRGLFDVIWRVAHQIVVDRVMLVAAGVTYYFLLALFPGLAAFVALYGLIADPASIADHVEALEGIAPAAAIDLVHAQLEAFAGQTRNMLNLAFYGGLKVSLWSVNSAIKALFEAMNIAYGERERRSFVRLTLILLGFTLGAIFTGFLLIFALGVIPTVLAFVDLGDMAGRTIAFARWPLLLAVIGFAITLIYRHGPDRSRAKWRWLTWGGTLATPLWLAASFAFSHYIENFADYNATYGTLGAVIGLMVWIWISVVIVIVGAELNAELEHQTARDSTTGAPKPMGEHGAVVADTLGKARGQ